jgi:hypothetical protein
MERAMNGIDHHRLAQVRALLGSEQLLGLAGQFADGLATLVDLPAADQANLLHRLRGGAASLGLDGLAADLAAAETGQGSIAALAQQAQAVVPMLAAALHDADRQR